MNSVEKAQRDMLFALVSEASRGRSWEDNLSKLKAKYHLTIPDHLLSASLEPWEDEGLLAVSRHSDGSSAFVKPSRYGTALSRLMGLLGATQLEFNWDKEEILTDAEPDDSWPGLPGWKILSFKKEVAACPNEVGQSQIANREKMADGLGKPIDWTKWGTILAGVGIVISVLLWKFS